MDCIITPEEVSLRSGRATDGAKTFSGKAMALSGPSLAPPLPVGGTCAKRIVSKRVYRDVSLRILKNAAGPLMYVGAHAARDVRIPCDPVCGAVSEMCTCVRHPLERSGVRPRRDS